MITLYNILNTDIYDLNINTFNVSCISMSRAIRNACIPIFANRMIKRPISVKLYKQTINELDETDDKTNTLELIAHFYSDTSNMTYKVLCQIHPLYTNVFSQNDHFNKMIHDTKYHAHYMCTLDDDGYSPFELENTKHLKLSPTPIQTNIKETSVNDKNEMTWPKFKSGDRVHINNTYDTCGYIMNDHIKLKYNVSSNMYEWVYNVLSELDNECHNQFESELSINL